MKISILTLAAITQFGCNAFADEPSFECKNKTLVEYKPGPQWTKLEQILPKHMGFIADQLKAGNISSAGPMMSETEMPVGGMAIYNITELNAVDALTKMDPMVSEGIATYTVKSWRQCVLK